MASLIIFKERHLTFKSHIAIKAYPQGPKFKTITIFPPPQNGKRNFFSEAQWFCKRKKTAVAAKLSLATFRSGEKYFFSHLVSL